MQNRIRKLLTNSVLSLSAAVLLLLMTSTQSMAADGDAATTSATANGATITASQVAGILITANTATTMAIATAGTDLVFGAANDKDAFTAPDASNQNDHVINITDAGDNDPTTGIVSFLGDIDLDDDSDDDDTLAINITNTNVLISGGVNTNNATDVVITLSGANSGVTLTVDTDAAGAENIEAAILSSTNAAASAILAITDSNGGASNHLTFTGLIGGGAANTALDSITLAADTSTVFSGTVRATTITNSATGTTTFNGNVTGNLVMAANGTVVFAASKGVTGTITNSTGTDNQGTLTIVGTTSAAFTGAIGATGAKLAAVNSNITNGDAAAVTFGGDVHAAAIGFTGNADDSDIVVVSGDLVGAVLVTTGGRLDIATNKKIVGSATTAADGVGILLR
jgi:hypothetical protein